MTFETSFIANREVRLIPAGWQHPKDEKGRYVPHLSRYYYDDLMQTLEPDEPGRRCRRCRTRAASSRTARDRRLRDDHGGHSDLARLPEHAGRQAGAGQLVRRARDDLRRLQGWRGSLGGDAVHGPRCPGRPERRQHPHPLSREQRGLRGRPSRRPFSWSGGHDE